MAKWDPLFSDEPMITGAFNKMLTKNLRVIMGIDPPPPPPTKEQEREREIYRLKYMIEENEMEITALEDANEEWKKELAELEREK